MCRDIDHSDRAQPPHRVMALIDGGANVADLILTEGTGDERISLVFTTTAPVLVGREAVCGLRFNDARISRCHAVLVPRRGWWIVRDLASRNGTVLNGARLRPGAPLVLSNHDQLEFGNAGAFHVRLSGAPATTIVDPGDAADAHLT